MANTTPAIAPRECVDDHYVDTAAALLDLLNPRHQLWCDDPPGWLFRGQTNAEWKLQPSAYRDTIATFARVGITTRMDSSTHAEWNIRGTLLNALLERFGDGLDRSGLAIPVAHPELNWRRRRTTSSNAEPDHALYPLMALAQHHGLPTTLLDWSRRSLVGAYFAAVDAADESRRADASHVAVWALYRGGRRTADGGLWFFEAPASTNPNLRAQDGLFTLIPPSDADDRSIEDYLVRMEQVMRTVAPKAAAEGARVAPLRRIMLPVSETKTLLRLLSHEGITGASMFPGTDGVVRAMRERVLWDAPVHQET